MSSFSAKDRKLLIEQISSTDFDVLVVGGGITGAGIALDATARGLKVALVEMQDFAGGTSGRSTKLIHGGLRYLKQLEFRLVREVGREREIIHKIAPHLTRPEPMILPITKSSSLNRFTAVLGMSIYEWLAGVKKNERYKYFNPQETVNAEPLLNRDDLLGSTLFYECRTDDARLTLEVLKEAVRRGAVAINYLRVTDFIYSGNKICGAKIHDRLSGEAIEVKAKYIVNAGGPWVDELDHLDKQKNDHLILTKGVHIVVDNKKFPIRQAIYFDTFDKRMIFVIPRDGKVYIGTTDTFYKGDVKNPEVSREDKLYLLKCINEFFRGVKLNESDIESHWAGLRPLINKNRNKPSEISRKDEMFVSTSGLITIAGGKLTGYRKMAERVVNRIARKIYKEENIILKECSTQSISLGGDSGDFDVFLKEKLKEGDGLGLTQSESERLIYRYGGGTKEIFDLIRKLRGEESVLSAVIRSELTYAIEKEMCMTPADFFIRRTGMIYFDISSVTKMAQEVVIYMKKLLDWNEQDYRLYDAELNKILSKI